MYTAGSLCPRIEPRRLPPQIPPTLLHTARPLSLSLRTRSTITDRACHRVCRRPRDSRSKHFFFFFLNGRNVGNDGKTERVSSKGFFVTRIARVGTRNKRLALEGGEFY